jgi:hypothetical protein
MLGLCQIWEGGIPGTMQRESSGSAFCEMGRDQVLVRGAKDEREDGADSQMEVLHVVFPFNKLAREWKLVCRGLCCLVRRCGLCWR